MILILIKKKKFLVWLAFSLLFITCLDGLENKQKTKKYFLSVCSSFKNESRYLKEWIEYHRLIGVDHFYLYDFSSSDNFTEVIRPYLAKGVIHLIKWPGLTNQEEDPIRWMLSMKIPAYENAAKYRALHETEWLVFLDVNEFLVPPESISFREILNKYADFPGVVLVSDYFDAAPTNGLPQRKLIIESTTLSNPPSQMVEKRVEKTIFKPERILGFKWPPYTFVYKDFEKPVEVKASELRINSYVNRNVSYFHPQRYKPKMRINTKDLPCEEKKELLEHYAVEDEELSISRYVPEIKKRMGIH